jgi:hypothetical protein
MFRDYLLENGVGGDQIIAVNFEDMTFGKINDAEKLHDYITARLITGKQNYIFLDEVQHVKEFQKAVDSLYIRKNVDIYLTGSNAFMLSGKLATLLSALH